MKYSLLFFIISILFLGCERPNDINQEDDGFPPSVPEGLRIYYAADAEIIIDWIPNRQLDVKGYNIYRRTEQTNYEFIGFSSYEYYTDVFLEYDTLYFYKITAVDYSGLESAYTNEVSARPENKYRPQIPASLSINARNWEGNKSIYLKWIENDEYDIEGYKIFRSDSSGFTPDSGNMIGFTNISEYEERTALEMYKKYYYRIIAVDKGNLESNPSSERSDLILEAPGLIIPGDNSTVKDFREFSFLSTGAPASYKLIVQSNQYFGEIWQTDIITEKEYDTIKVKVPPGVFSYNTNYYWRVAAFTESDQPNSFSPVYKFIIKP